MGLLAASPSLAWAQGIEPPSADDFVVYDPATGEFSLNLESLTPVGTVVADAPDSWYVPSFLQTIDIAGSTFNPLKMTYNRYVSPEGYYVLVPSLYTAVVMSFTGNPPFDVEPIGMVVDGYVGIAGYMGWMENIGFTRDDVLEGDWKDDPEFWAELFLAINDPQSPLHEGTLFLPPAVLVYACDPTNPADCSPATDADEPGDSTPPLPSSANCPAPSAVQAEIRASGELLAPPYPVVVGQDRSRRGADLKWCVEIPPVIYTWYQEVVVGTRTVCAYDPAGKSGGCPGPGAQYDAVIGSEIGWQSFMATGPSAGYWRAIPGQPEINCVKHVEVYSDRLAWVRTSASLTEPSRHWILKELAARYPGAELYQPEWTWLPPTSGSVMASGTFLWEWVEREIAFRDPGEYEQNVAGATTGTPVSAPRSFNLLVGRFPVWLHEATLSR
jgi:hypothetical protein